VEQEEVEVAEAPDEAGYHQQKKGITQLANDLKKLDLDLED